MCNPNAIKQEDKLLKPRWICRHAPSLPCPNAGDGLYFRNSAIRGETKKPNQNYVLLANRVFPARLRDTSSPVPMFCSTA